MNGNKPDFYKSECLLKKKLTQVLTFSSIMIIITNCE